jgi:hypothetical protein
MAELELDFAVKWLPQGDGDTPSERATFAELTVVAGPDRIPITEVDDAIAQTVRPDIRVPVIPLAQWLITNWWRLRWESQWEPRKDRLLDTWLRAHNMASVSSDVPWPALQITSNGEFIHLEARAEHIRDVAAIRYLRDVNVVIPAEHFERAIDRFLARLDERIASCAPGDRELADLIAELREERGDPQLARMCRLQALAGLDPGTAPRAWLEQAMRLADAAGTTGDEIVAAVPLLRAGLDGVDDAVSAMKASSIDVRLTADFEAHREAAELPWQRGRRLAAQFRAHHDLDDGPVPNGFLEQWLEVRLPLPTSPDLRERGLTGGYRNGSPRGRTRLLVTTQRPDNQRFYLGRLIGAALVTPPGDHVLPVTSADTAFQKLERSFAQELLCPWSALDAYTDEHGTDDEGIAAAAEHFEVSEYLVLSTLVNNDKLERERLPPG